MKNFGKAQKHAKFRLISVSIDPFWSLFLSATEIGISVSMEQIISVSVAICLVLSQPSE
jgi:hypothetical protein